MSLCSNMWLFLMLVVLHFGKNMGSDSFSILVPGEKILVSPGSTVTLPCSVTPGFHPTELRWYRPDKYSTPVLLYQKLQAKEEVLDPQYMGRASLVGVLQEGNASLKLENLTVADSGEYLCYIQRDNWYEKGQVFTEVRVLGSIPLISVTDGGSGQVNVTCVSEGWSPQPTLTWTNRKETEIKQGPYEVHSKDDLGLVKVSSWMLVTPSDLGVLLCAVGVSDQERRESRVALHLSRVQTCVDTPTSGSGLGKYQGVWKYILIAVLALCLLGIALFYLYKQGLIKWSPFQNICEKQGDMKEETVKLGIEEKTQLEANTTLQNRETITGESSKVITEIPFEKPKGENKGTNTEVVVTQTPEWDQVKRHKVILSLDHKTVPKSLAVKGKTVFCPHPEQIHGHDGLFPHVLCEKALDSGRHYWEVDMKKVSEKQSWYVGVCSGTVAKERTRVPLTPENGFWVLRYEKGTGLFANTEPPYIVPTTKLFSKLGVYLDIDQTGDTTLSFYNVDKEFPLCSFQYFTLPDSLIPVLSPGLRDKHPILIC